MGAGEQEGVEDFHSQKAFYEAAAGPLIDQVRKWLTGRGQKFSQAAFVAIERTVELAIEALDLDLETTADPAQLAGALLDRCAQMGYVVCFRPEPHPILGRKMRACIDRKGRIIEIYQVALATLAERLPQELRNLVIPLVISHELFHALAPRCRHSELGAHLFAARVCSSPFFPGLLDAE